MKMQGFPALFQTPKRLTNYHVGFYSLSKLFGIHPCALSRIFRGQRTLDRDKSGVFRYCVLLLKSDN
jgi:hypothetical protein